MRYGINKLTTLLTSSIMFLVILTSFFTITNAGQSSNIYVCNGSVNKGYAGATYTIGEFNNDNEFSQSDYTSISVNDENFIKSLGWDESNCKYAYHRFMFLINENIQDITKINICWRGGTDSDNDNETSFWLKENGIWKYKTNQKNTQDYNMFYYNITSNFDKIISNNYLNLGFYSNESFHFYGSAVIAPKQVEVWDYGYFSNISSYYLEVKVFLSSSEPQLDISSPSSVSEGCVFSVNVTSSGIPVEGVAVAFSEINYYTGSDGIAKIVAPFVNTDTDFLITASKDTHISNQKTIKIVNNISIEPQLDISSPSSVSEGCVFSVTVTASSVPIDKVRVSFSVVNYYTGSDGIAKIVAPLVSQDTTFNIVVYKSNYQESQSQIMILNNKTITPKGYIYGTVYDNKKIPINDTVVCAFSTNNDKIKNVCTLTDEKGFYNISIDVGKYTVTAEKLGYETGTVQNVEVNENIGNQINFTLDEKGNITGTLTDYIIMQEIKKGSILGSVDVSTEDKHVKVYSDVNIELEAYDISSDKGINILLSGEGKPGTKIVVYLGVIDNPDSLIVTYDSNQVEETKDVTSFFEKCEDAKWILISVNEEGFNKYILIFNIPHYSEHELVIKASKTIIDYTDALKILVFYITAIALSAIIFIGSIYFRKRI